MADIYIVQPVEGAARVDFDFAAAGAAIDALDTMDRKLDEQREGRVGPRNQVVEHWEGYFRQEFDRAWGDLQNRFTSAGGTGAKQAIYAGVREANEAQRRYNRIAEEESARRLIESAGAAPV